MAVVTAPDARLPSSESPDRANIGRLIVTCPDQPGIVTKVTGVLFSQGANITELQQHSTDPFHGMFFLRVEFFLPDLVERLADVQAELETLGVDPGLKFRLVPVTHLPKLAIFVSKADHAIQELLWQQHTGDLPAEVTCVVSNHPDLEEVAARFNVPYHYIPVTADTKAEAEAAQLDVVNGKVDAIVLARYMQVVSGDFLSKFDGQVINIHHSFLPAFVGANPYKAAFDRGVKLIGATAHYVTEDLDAGPIIVQDVQPVDHRQDVKDLRALGRYVERRVLARAVQLHVDDRVFVVGNKTVVFD